MNSASLVVVGSGIKFYSHLTHEAKSNIIQSDKVLYLVNDPVMQEWIKKNNPRAESLDELYFKYSLRKQSYEAITNYILDNLHSNKHVCVVLYGHPTVLAQPALDAVIQAKAEGFYAKTLPAISSEDCLYADLMINPSYCGCQSYEATDFLIHQRKIDDSGHLILWQIDNIGMLGHSAPKDNKGIKLLVTYLQNYYKLNHEVIIYEAAQYPYFDPRIDKLPLSKLPEAHLTRISTLYVPPGRKALCDVKIALELNIDIADLN